MTAEVVLKTVLDTHRNALIERHFKKYFSERFQDFNQENLRHQLPKDLEKDYIHYYKAFGFPYVSTDEIKTYYALTGIYDRRILNSGIFNKYIDPIYPQIRDFWQNKAYQSRIVPVPRYPRTIVRNVNGYYIDQDHSILTEREALDAVKAFERVVIKPSIYTGGGLNVRLFASGEVDEKVLRSYGRDFIIQDRIRQSRQMAGFNESTVNTEKIMSFLYHGEVHILSAFIRIGAPGADVDNVTDQAQGKRVRINEDGTFNSFGYDGYFNKVYKTEAGEAFQGIKLEQHRKCIDIIKRSHPYLLNFPIVSWDFAHGEDGEPVLVEYNLKWHELFDFQIQTGPLFGDMTEGVLREAAVAAASNRGLFYR